MSAPRTCGVVVQRSAALRLACHPDAPLSQDWASWVRGLAKPKAADLFSGAGGLSLGLEQAGYDVVLAVDHDTWACETHRANFRSPTLELDLSDPERVDALINMLTSVELDLVAGGPPCQPFSKAGRSKIRSLVDSGARDPVDARRDLWQVFLRVVEECRPKAVLMENVPDMALGDELATVRHIIDRLEGCGYQAAMSLVDAWRYGVPQHRQRLILVGLQHGTWEWPKEDTEPVTVEDAIGDLPCLGDTTGDSTLPYSGPHSPLQRTARIGMPLASIHQVWDHVTRAVRADDREAFLMLTDPTLRYGDLPEHLRRYRADIFDDKYHRLTWDDLSRSITAHIAKDGYWYIHPGEPRTLTVREAARIQTFPDRFRFAGSRSHAFAQIGNAVPPKLAAVMAGAVLTAVDREPPADQLQPSVWRAAIRTALLEWWNRRGGVALWQRVGDPWAVLVGTIFGRDRQIGGHPGAVGYLDRFPYPQNVTPAHSATFAAKAEDDKQQLAMRRLNGAGLLIKKDGWESDWCKAAGLGPAERLWVERIGLKADALLSTGRSLRVAARLTGTSVDRERSGSDGKIQLGLLVGSGSDVPHLNVALDTLGRDTCTSGIPRCNDCPLSELCASARVS